MNQQLNITIFFIILVLLLSSQALATDVSQDSVESRCSEEHSRVLTEGLSNRKAGDELCDATIMVGDKSFRVHKVIMSIFSPYFETSFKSEMRGGMERQDEFTLNSDNIDADAFEMLKDYMYTRQITIDDSTVQRLLAGASYLQMTNVKAHCCAYMKKEVNVENCIGIKYIADEYSCSELSNYATDFILDSFEGVAKSGEFFVLTKDQLIDIISDDQLATSEYKIFEAVMRWIRYRDSSVGDRIVHLPDILQHVRFSQMESEYLVRVSKDPLIKACKQCLEYVKEAEDYLSMCHLSVKRADDEPSLNARFKPRRTDYLFAVGGYIDRTKDATSSVERYDPKIDKWTEVASMQSPRCWLGVAALNNILYAVSGFDGSDYLRSIECYDPHTDKWTDNLRPMEFGRSPWNGVTTSNGMLYVIGGDHLRRKFSVMKYDPNVNEWIERKPLRQKKYYFAVAVLAGYIYVLGGKTIDDKVSNSVERYDPQQNEWYDVSPMITKRCDFGSAAHGNYLYAVGGHGEDWIVLDSAERYDPRKDRWERIPPMNESRCSLGLAVVNGLIYAAGGLDSEKVLTTVAVYDPATNTWSGRAQMLKRRFKFGLAAMNY